MELQTIFGIFIIGLVVVRSEIPTDFPKCHHKDETCLVKAANTIIQKYHGGVPMMNMPAFDPIHVDALRIATHPSNSVNVSVSLFDIELNGLKSMDVTVLRGLRKDLSGRVEFGGTIKELDFRGRYKIDGRIMVLPIGGEGLATFVCKDIKLNLTFALKPITKNGENFVKMQKLRLDLEVDHIHFEFDNIFNSKELTEAMNSFINENMKEIFDETKSVISKEVGVVIRDMVNSFLEKHPYENFFLKD